MSEEDLRLWECDEGPVAVETLWRGVRVNRDEVAPPVLEVDDDDAVYVRWDLVSLELPDEVVRQVEDAVRRCQRTAGWRGFSTEYDTRVEMQDFGGDRECVMSNGHRVPVRLLCAGDSFELWEGGEIVENANGDRSFRAEEDSRFYPGDPDGARWTVTCIGIPSGKRTSVRG